MPIEASTVTIDDASVAAAVNKILDEHYQENCNTEVYRTLFNCIDLTTLATTDSPASVSDFYRESQLRLRINIPTFPTLQPSVCIPLSAPGSTRRARRKLGARSLCGRSLSFRPVIPEVKVAETAMAVSTGADEIDMVFPSATISTVTGKQ